MIDYDPRMGMCFRDRNASPEDKSDRSKYINSLLYYTVEEKKNTFSESSLLKARCDWWRVET